MSASVEPDENRIYQIKVKGVLPECWSDWFGGMTLTCEAGKDGSPITALTGPVIDQPALRGILDRLLDLNLALISVEQIELSHLPSGGERNEQTLENVVA